MNPTEETLRWRATHGDDNAAAFLSELDALRAQPTIAQFILEVNRRAERTMESTGMVSGAHWNAMQVVAKEWGVDVSTPKVTTK